MSKLRAYNLPLIGNWVHHPCIRCRLAPLSDCVKCHAELPAPPYGHFAAGQRQCSHLPSAGRLPGHGGPPSCRRPAQHPHAPHCRAPAGLPERCPAGGTKGPSRYAAALPCPSWLCPIYPSCPCPALPALPQLVLWANMSCPSWLSPALLAPAQPCAAFLCPAWPCALPCSSD